MQGWRVPFSTVFIKRVAVVGCKRHIKRKECGSLRSKKGESAVVLFG